MTNKQELEKLYLYTLARWTDEKLKELGFQERTVFEQLDEEQQNAVQRRVNELTKGLQNGKDT